ncbi:MAG: Cyclohexadienyl dehydrogenase [Anaerolineae bacterium]|nr:Cyclohexadienyl dehydrogenase [Anaerolineae bacterium]
MGGSLGLALKENRVCRRVVGLVRRPEAVTQALELGVVDAATLDPAEALGAADIVIFSTPIRTILRQLREYAPLFKAGAIITDMGSTKQQITQAMAALPDGLQPIGSHPMCGKEIAGMAAAEASLYRDAPWVLAPLPRTAPETTATVRQLAQAIGAKTLELEPARHDQAVAAISHLPYTLAASLVLAAQSVAATDPAVWQVRAGGFRDTSRVAATDTTMMLDILLTNRAAVGQLIDLARQRLDDFATAIAAGDETSLRELMEQAARQRRDLYL